MLKIPRVSRVTSTIVAALLAAGLGCSENSSDTIAPRDTASALRSWWSSTASVSVTIDSTQLAVGHTAAAKATALDSRGNALSGKTPTWTSSNTAVASVSSGGVVTGVKAGSADIQAVIDGVTGKKTITIVAAGTSSSTPGTVAANECASPGSGWIFCDDFESDRTAKYFEYDNAGGKFIRTAATGVGGSVGMRATYTKGQTSAGSLKLAFGRTPSTSFRPVDAGTANYRELYWRFFVRREAGWVGDGPGKLTRAMILAKSDWSQAMIAHGWSDETDMRYLLLDPATGVNSSGAVTTVGYNDFTNLKWLGGVRSAAPEDDNAHAGVWACYEFHVKLNDAGQSNGVFDLSVNGQASAKKTGLNWVGSYNAYGLNAVLLEQYTNAGAPANNVRTLDNFVVSTQPIGCGGGTTGGSTGGSTTPPPATPAPVAAVSVSMPSSSLTTGQTAQASAKTIDAAGNTLTGRTITWNSSNSSVASVSSTGMVTSTGAGTANIMATSEGVQGQAPLTVAAPAPVAVASVSVSVAASSIVKGATTQATATTKDASGNTLTGRTITWTSSNTAVATVGSTGVVTGVAAGTATITATSEGKTGQTGMTVTAPVAPVATVAVSLASSSIQAGATTQGTAVTRDASGNTLTGRTVTWTSSNAAIASVNASGLVTGVAAGSATITATSETKTGTATITVTAAVSGGTNPGGGTGTPILTEDFSTYSSTSNLHADPRNIYGSEEFGGPWGQWNLITLDQTTGVADVGAGTSHQSMKYTWPDRTNATGVQPDANRCSDFYIVKTLQLPPNLTEVWTEFYVKFSTNFTTKAPAAWGCASNPDYKFIFLTTTPGNRFSLKNDYAGLGTRWDPTAPGQGDGDNNFVYNNYHDNQWHRIRIHSKIATSGSNGAHEIWLDGTKVYSSTNIATGGQGTINAINLGNNMNQGPDHIMSVNWGQIKVWNANPGW